MTTILMGMTQQQRDEFLKQSILHADADMLAKNTFGGMLGGTFKGCSVGCHLRHIRPDFDGEEHDYRDKHGIVAGYYGFPEWLPHLQDKIFEGLPFEDGVDWHRQIAETLHALPDNYDWQRALHRILAAILRTALGNAGSASKAVTNVVALHERAARGESVPDKGWVAAKAAARVAADTAEMAAWATSFKEIRDAVLAALRAQEPRP